jgi:hypothetical protein
MGIGAMTTCGKCGAQLQGDERFCVKCGSDLSVQAAAGAGTVTAGSGVGAMQVPQSVQPVAAQPVYAAPGGVPIAVPLPMPAPQKKRGFTWVVVVLVVLVAAYYYHAKHQPVAGTQPGSDPSAPGANPPAQPGAQPSAQPNSPPGSNPAQPVATPAEVSQQSLTGRWVASYGFVEVVTARWTNNSPVTMRAATLECVQYAANGAALSETTDNLNGPVAPGGSANFGPFQMGRIVAYASRVNCGIIQAYPAS